jgi:hypothetical protein
MAPSQLQLKPTNGNSSFNWTKAIVLGFGGLLLVLLLFRLPSIIALYQLYWSGEGIRKLFYEDLGFSEAWTSFIAVVFSFVYALAWVPLTLWSYRLLAWHFDQRQLMIAFASWVFIYGHAPLLHALFGRDTCFNQRTGEPMKWYTEAADGTIVLYDSGGYDSTTGEQKKQASLAICTAYEKQRNNERPRRITADATTLEFFDPITGRPRVWYAKNPDGTYTLYDRRGFDPATSQVLQPITADVAQDIKAKAAAAVEDQRRRDADAQLKRQQQIDQEAAQQRQRQQQIDRQAAQDRQRRDEELAAARAREEAKRQAEQDAINRQIEMERQQQQRQQQQARDREQARMEWRRTHNGCDIGTHQQYFDCQRTSAPECIHIGGNGGYACVRD